MSRSGRAPSRPAGRVSLSKYPIFAVVVLVLLVAAAELGARILVALLPSLLPPPPTRFDIVNDLESDKTGDCFVRDPTLFWRLRPNLEACEWRTSTGVVETVRTNEHGLRRTGQSYTKTKPPGALRILLVGDSVTYGLWVREGETFGERLRALLAERMAPREVEVINAGVPGYSSWQGLAYFRRAGVAFEPDYATVCFGYNDQNPSEVPDRVLAEDPAYRDVLAGTDSTAKGLRSVLRRSRLYRLLVRLVHGSEEGRQRGPRDVPRVGPDDYRRNFESFAEIAASRGIHVVFVPPPWGNDRARASTEAIRTYRAILRDVADRTATPVAPIDPLTEADQAINRPFFHDVIHPNARGHAVLAEALAGIILELEGGGGR